MGKFSISLKMLLPCFCCFIADVPLSFRYRVLWKCVWVCSTTCYVFSFFSVSFSFLFIQPSFHFQIDDLSIISSHVMLAIFMTSTFIMIVRLLLDYWDRTFIFFLFLFHLDFTPLLPTPPQALPFLSYSCLFSCEWESFLFFFFVGFG